MKPIHLILILLVLLAAGCASATPATTPAQAPPTPAQASSGETNPPNPTPTQAEQASTAYPAPTNAEKATQGYPAPTEAPSQSSAYPYPTDTTTGIAIVDKVVAAATSTDHKGLIDLIHYTNTKCTKAQGLGGPPKCLDSEADGTSVDVLPLLGPEGSFIRKTDLTPDFFQGQYQLLAVYKVKPDANPDPNYPPGTYGILLLRTDKTAYESLRVDDQGIVRLDTEMGTLGKDFPKTDQFILQLKTSY